MNTGTPSSSALAHTGWNLGSANATPATLPPIAAPFMPCFFTAVSSSCTARSGACKVSNPVGLRAAQLRQFLILNFDDLGSQIAVAVVPVGVDRQHFHIDGLGV